MEGAFSRDFDERITGLGLHFGAVDWPDHEGKRVWDVGADFELRDGPWFILCAGTSSFVPDLTPGVWNVDVVDAFGRGLPKLAFVRIEPGAPCAAKQRSDLLLMLLGSLVAHYKASVEEKARLEPKPAEETLPEDPRMTSQRYRSEYTDGQHLQKLLNRLDFDGYSVLPKDGGGIFPEWNLLKAGDIAEGKPMYRIVAYLKSERGPVEEAA
jgi:hypothetical protein